MWLAVLYREMGIASVVGLVFAAVWAVSANGRAMERVKLKQVRRVVFAFLLGRLCCAAVPVSGLLATVRLSLSRRFLCYLRPLQELLRIDAKRERAFEVRFVASLHWLARPRKTLQCGRRRTPSRMSRQRRAIRSLQSRATMRIGAYSLKNS